MIAAPAHSWDAPFSASSEVVDKLECERTFYFLEDPGDSILTGGIEPYSGRRRNPRQGLGERVGINII